MMSKRTIYDRLASLEANVAGHEKQLGGVNLAQEVKDLMLEVQCLREEIGNMNNAS